MATKQATINETGLQAIRDFCAQWLHVEVTDRCVHACASEAESSFDAGNGAAFELSPFMTIDKRPHVCVIGPEGYDIDELDDDE